MKIVLNLSEQGEAIVQRLLKQGLHGTTREEVVQRLICAQFSELERERKFLLMAIKPPKSGARFVDQRAREIRALLYPKKS